MWITAVMMVVEVAAGWWFSSMALLADGWHMSSHALAIGLSALAYAASRRYATDPRFAFGTWKVEVLGGFASAVFLLGVAVMMLVESVDRLWEPQPIQYLEAIAVSVVGLAVNLVCAAILGRAQHDHDRHGHQLMFMWRPMQRRLFWPSSLCWEVGGSACPGWIQRWGSSVQFSSRCG
jgi:cation diffusion facilitator family transporter